jgi:hypothetical protein
MSGTGQDIVDLDIVVGLDHYAIDEEPNQSLPCGEVGGLETYANLSNEIWELRTEPMAKLGVVERSICLLEGITKNCLAALDLLTSAEQIVHLKSTALVGVDKPLELTVAILEFPIHSSDLYLKRLRSSFAVESRMSCNAFRIGH